MVSEMQLRVVTPDRVVVDQTVHFVKFMGTDGSYGILPHHAPLMTGTRPGIVTIEHVDGRREEMLITSGFAEMRDNVLSLICQAGEMAHEIDPKRAAEAEERARKRIEQGGTTKNIDLPRAREALERAELRLLLAKRGGNTPARG